MAHYIPFYPELLERGGTLHEVLLYGLILSAAAKSGSCFASNEYMAKKIGVAQGTVKNLLSRMVKKRWITVESKGNKRISVTPMIHLKAKRKRAAGLASNNTSTCGKLCGKHSAKLVDKNSLRHARMTLASRQDDAGSPVVTGNRIPYLII